MTGIKDKIIAITGASSGIGEATAVLLAQQGAKLVLGARGADRLSAITASIVASGGDAACLTMDVTRRDDLARWWPSLASVTVGSMSSSATPGRVRSPALTA